MRPFILTLFFLSLASIAVAQRSIDLKVISLWSDSSASSFKEFKNTDTFTIDGIKAYYFGWNIKNESGDTLKFGDTIFVNTWFGIKYVVPILNMQSMFLAPGDSATVTPSNNPLTILPGSGPRNTIIPVNWCDSVWMIDKNRQLVQDTNTSNNIYCNTVTGDYHKPGSTSIAETNGGLAKMVIYPNPAKDKLNVSYNFRQHTQTTLRLIDITGKTVLSTSIDHLTNEQEITLELPALSTGLYIVELNSGDAILHQRVQIE